LFGRSTDDTDSTVPILGENLGEQLLCDRVAIATVIAVVFVPTDDQTRHIILVCIFKGYSDFVIDLVI
jgi:hypothetical protein